MKQNSLTSIINEIFKLDKSDATNFNSLKTFISNKYNRNLNIHNNHFGIHPDYVHFKDTLVNGEVVSFFADIAGSTRLSANLPPRKVVKYKQIILDIMSEVIIAFDGFINRYQGDGILAFFNKKSNKISESIWNAILAANEIAHIITKHVAPKIEKEINDYKKNHNTNVQSNIGIRIGIDYGGSDSTIWGKVGSLLLQNVHEHTAMGVHVDAAAKIQNKINKNQIGIGENAVHHIGLDKEIYTSDSDNVITNPNYKYFVLNKEKFFNNIEKIIKPNNKIILKVDDNIIEPLTKVIAKNKDLIYEFVPSTMIDRLKKKVWWIRNTGEEAKKENLISFETKEEQNLEINVSKSKVKAKFNGLHYMICKSNNIELAIYPILICDDEYIPRILYKEMM